MPMTESLYLTPGGGLNSNTCLKRKDCSTTSSEHCLNRFTPHNGLHLHLYGKKVKGIGQSQKNAQSPHTVHA